MQFSKAEKILHDNNNFNPPPGYYIPEDQGFTSGERIQKHPANISTFTKQQRFNKNQNNNTTTQPGPGSYYNDRTARIKKRMLDQARKKQGNTGSDFLFKNKGEAEVKISSIPSIPKKSATRVYQELAPGILILHQQDNQCSNIGPGSYNIKENVCFKKPVAHKINPEPKKRKNLVSQQPDIIIPKIAEEIREQRRQMQKKKLFKSSGINKSMISPADLCLEVIILREKLLRSDENPPPGYYYNQKYQSSFKEVDPDLLPEYQLMMGKQERLKQEFSNETGPGDYDIETQNKKNPGGFIPKQQRKIHSEKKVPVPGPGSYKVQPAMIEPTQIKGNYPPIFGSGCNRFYSADKKSETTPGPGSYKINQNYKKKQKYLKIKKNFYDTQISKGDQRQFVKQSLISMGGDRGRSLQAPNPVPTKSQKTSHVFSSKVDRFSQGKQLQNQTGPGIYEASSSFNKNSFNKNRNQYIGEKQPRFNQSIIRPNIGPGVYFKK